MRRGISILVSIAVVLAAGMASAATFQFDLTVDEQAHTFDVFASVSTGDNAGLASFSLDLLNIDSARVVAPRGFDDAELRLKGFVTVSPALAGDGTAYGSQNVSDPNSLILGLGQTAGGLAVYPGSSCVGIPWQSPVRLVTGTYSPGEAPAIAPGAVADVFRQTGSTEMMTAVYVPEPLTVALLAVGGLWVRRRRRKA